jgi:transposase InsO family protein
VLGIRAASNNAWGGRKIARAMANGGAVEVPAPSTITAILRRHGKLNQRGCEHPGPCQRFERAAPNELWQMDFKGDFATGRGRCHPLTVVDDHSRYALAIGACADQQDASARHWLTGAFRRYGLPLAMLMDNGPPWGDTGRQRQTRFTVWLMRLGIKVSHGRPYHPQTQGKDERFHRSLKAEVLAGRSFADLAHCQHAFDRWRPIYNTQRPHEALGLAVPAARYRVSPRPYPETLPALEYAAGDLPRKADGNGKITFKGREWRIGKAFAGQLVALRPTLGDGVFTVHYCAHHIATLDLRPVLDGADLHTTYPQLVHSPEQQQQASLQST